MHFLCLHGRGTSSKIFQMQTAGLRYALGDDHTYTFLEGTVECEMAPEIGHLSDSTVPHFEYYSPSSAHSYLRSLDALDKFIQAQGPFDGILGFSQGAGMALMYLIRQAHLYPSHPHTIRVLVLLSRIGVYDPARWLKTGEVFVMESLPYGIDRLRIPVAAIWGKKDWEDVQAEGKTTKQLFDTNMVWEYVHEGSHEVPGTSVEGSVDGAVKIIRRATAEASIMAHGDL